MPGLPRRWACARRGRCCPRGLWRKSPMGWRGWRRRAGRSGFRCLARRPVRRDLALTGEVTLRGKVLEIGGVKEKVLAAYRAGLREVILPRQNEKDVRDVPAEVRARTFPAEEHAFADVLPVKGPK